VTNRENILRGTSPFALNARKAECKRGHTFTENNIYWYQGARHCRECILTKHKERRVGMTFRICKVCGKAVDWTDRFTSVEEMIGSQRIWRLSGHFDCVTRQYRVVKRYRK
jgi:hypothetical protein